MTPRDRLLLQGFEWHTRSPQDGESHYDCLARLLPSLVNLGVTDLWLPPGCKANNPQGNGYDIYDLWDLGDFDQKGSRSTKWGSREELENLMRKGKEMGIAMVWDAVLNHKMGGDETEECWAVEVAADDRRYEICSPQKIEAWLRFDFPERLCDGTNGTKMHWRAEHFNGVDWDQKDEKNAIYKLIDNPASASIPFAQPVRPSKSRENTSSIRSFFERPRTRVRSLLNTDRGAPAIRSGKGWATDVDKEHGNNDYLMCSNIDYKHPEVRKNISDWGGWMVQEIGVDGFRLDAAQHVSYGFTKAWIEKVQRASVASKGREVLIVGEVWTGELRRIADWLDAVQQPAGPQVYAYDSTLVYNFSRISEDFRTRSVNLDLRTVLDQTLLEARPEAAITLVTNHDTQFGQMSYTPMSRPLKLLFYAFILLRQEGLPCVFWGDLYGIAGPHAEAPIGLDGTADGPGFRHLLKDLMLCRRLFARGKQISYWHSMTCIGWIRKGTEDSVGCAVVLDIGKLSRPKPKRATTLSMAVGEPGETWIEIFTGHDHEVLVGEGGEGEFASSRLGVSIYVRKGTARPGFEAS